MYAFVYVNKINTFKLCKKKVIIYVIKPRFFLPKRNLLILYSIKFVRTIVWKSDACTITTKILLLWTSPYQYAFKTFTRKSLFPYLISREIPTNKVWTRVVIIRRNNFVKSVTDQICLKWGIIIINFA